MIPTELVRLFGPIKSTVSFKLKIKLKTKLKFFGVESFELLNAIVSIEFNLKIQINTINKFSNSFYFVNAKIN